MNGEITEGEGLRLSLSILGSFGIGEISGLARREREQVSQFYGDGRKVICGLRLRGARLACSPFACIEEQTAKPPRRASNACTQ